MATDNLELGNIIDPQREVNRDAIHIAVMPVIAGMAMRPDYDKEIGFVTGSTEVVTTKAQKFIGIIDPFLKINIEKGQKFWMFLFPNTITSLRHEWTHQDIDKKEDPNFAETKEKILLQLKSSKKAEEWLRSFCETSECPPYEDLLKALNGQELEDEYYSISFRGDYIHVSGMDAHGEIPDEFWNNMEKVLRRKIKAEDRATHFSCSC